MPLQKVVFKPGVNRENTRYTNEGGWYESDKVRFRQGTPEKIGGWQRISGYTYNGVCRSLWNWVTLGFLNLIGVGTNTKFYIANGGNYYDITPLRVTTTLGANPFATDGTTTVTVTAPSHGATSGSFVIFSGAAGTYSTTFNAEYQLTVVNVNAYTIVVPTALSGGPYGGSSVSAQYQVNAGPAYAVPLTGWGAGTWGQTGTTWGNGGTDVTGLQLWSQINYGQDLLFGPRGGGLYYWKASGGLTTRGVLLSSLGGTATFTNASPTVVTFTVDFTEGAALQFTASTSMPTGMTANTTYYVFNKVGLTSNLLDSNGAIVNTSSTGTGVSVSLIVDVPSIQNNITVSDASRFAIIFGCNDYGSSTLDPMLIRWSAQDDVYNWTPDATNQAGSTRLSHGSQIIAYVQTRQEIVVLTDSSVYSLQYLGPPYVWQSQLLGDNISIISPNAAIIASGVVYWMGVDKFYSYDGRVQTLNCDLRRYVFSDLNQQQAAQVFCGTNEGFNEVWWFYCSSGSSLIDKYVIYNYFEKVWYYGTMARTAWLDSGLREYPLAAVYTPTTSTGNLVNHEQGINNDETATTAAIDAYISSSEFDIGDGHNFAFVWRVLPDLTFSGSTDGTSPEATLTLYPMYNSGSGTNNPVANTAYSINLSANPETFTGEVYTRVRGRQLIIKMESNKIGTTWQLGAPRLDIRPDGRR